MSENFKTLMIGVSAGTIGGSKSTHWTPNFVVGAYLVIQEIYGWAISAFRIISGYVVGPLNLATSWQSFRGRPVN